ncbi:MAG: hypothetical protein RLZZ347_581 [Candidatus Parcubacteria bacterium]|jgi:16S rRNA (guanine1207-N2)-methyltransferase
MPSLPTQLLIKHLPKLASKKALIINAPESELLSILSIESPATDWSFFDFEYSDHREKMAFAKQVNFSAEKLTCGAWPTIDSRYDLIVIFLPKSRELLEYTLTIAPTYLTPHGIVAVVGEKKSGIKSTSSALEKYVGKILWKEPGKHSEIIVASLEKSVGIFTPSFITTRVVAHDTPLTIASLPGVFSLGELDKGTGLLLSNLPDATPTKVLDWGCGSGVIGTCIAKKYLNTTVDLVDSNTLAVASTKETLRVNRVTNARVFASDIFSDVTATYDLIVSNPPFHDGIKTSYDATYTFFKDAPKRLAPGGKLLIVANAFLPYQKVLTEIFGNCRIVAENPQFKVLESIQG